MNQSCCSNTLCLSRQNINPRLTSSDFGLKSHYLPRTRPFNIENTETIQLPVDFVKLETWHIVLIFMR